MIERVPGVFGEEAAILLRKSLPTLKSAILTGLKVDIDIEIENGISIGSHGAVGPLGMMQVQRLQADEYSTDYHDGCADGSSKRAKRAFSFHLGKYLWSWE